MADAFRLLHTQALPFSTQEKRRGCVYFFRGKTMNDSKMIVRYIGYRSLQGGGRGFDFSFAQGGNKPTMISIDASFAFFQGPDRIAIQEAAAICYETLKWRAQLNPASTPDRFDLTSADVAQHRKIPKTNGSRH